MTRINTPSNWDLHLVIQSSSILQAIYLLYLLLLLILCSQIPLYQILITLPIPEDFTPPNGSLGSDLTISFTLTTPLQISLARLSPLSKLPVQILAPNPNSELFTS